MKVSSLISGSTPQSRRVVLEAVFGFLKKATSGVTRDQVEEFAFAQDYDKAKVFFALSWLRIRGLITYEPVSGTYTLKEDLSW